MTEVVTSSAAIPQLNLLAQRQQVVGLSIPGNSGAPTFQPTDNKTSTSALQGETVGHHQTSDQLATQSSDQNPTPSGSGPSRPRVEIKSYDFGLTPAEVVGTLDVLQRLDSNGDGRVDMFEAARANDARDSKFTFAALAPAPPPNARIADTQPVTADQSVSKIVTPVAPAQTVPVQTPAAAVTQAAAIVASQAVTDDGADAPKKFDTQAVAVAPAIAATQKPAPIVVVNAGSQAAVAKDGGGEPRLYDKVAQTDTANQDSSGNGQTQNGFGQGAANDRGAPFDQTQAVAVVANSDKKTGGVGAYAATASVTAPTTASAAATTVVTA